MIDLPRRDWDQIKGVLPSEPGVEATLSSFRCTDQNTTLRIGIDRHTPGGRTQFGQIVLTRRQLGEMIEDLVAKHAAMREFGDRLRDAS